MDDHNLLKEKLLQVYKPDIDKLSRYIPYFEEKGSKDVMSAFESPEADETGNLFFPVYDSTLLSFVKEARSSALMNKNHPYVYSRNRIRSVKDEWYRIDHADLKEFDVLTGILSKYVLKGAVKATLWTEAVEYKIFYKILLKMKEIETFWDRQEE